MDVYPANSHEVELGGLRPGKRYSVAVMALNNIGESEYSSDNVVFTTAGSYSATIVKITRWRRK